MESSFHDLARTLLRPTPTRLEHCWAIAAAQQARRRKGTEERTRRLAECERRIEAARARVFAAADGVVREEMTSLEREWRTLAQGLRLDPSDVAMLWRAVAPRGSSAALPLRDGTDGERGWDAVIALASDPDGVAKAESSARLLTEALSGWGVTAARRVEWVVSLALPTRSIAEALFDAPTRASQAALVATYGGDAIVLRAARHREELFARLTVASRGAGQELVSDVAQASFTQHLWNACVVERRVVPDGHPNAGRSFHDLPHPTTALVELWRTGYVLLSVGTEVVTLGALPAARPA